MKINLDSENLALKANANASYDSAQEWYSCYGAHISSEHRGDLDVQSVEFDWLNSDKETDGWRTEQLAALDVPSLGDFTKCDDLPNINITSAIRDGDESDLQTFVDYFRDEDSYGEDEGLMEMGGGVATDIEGALEQVKEINKWARKANSYAALKIKEMYPREVTWYEIDSLVDLAKGVREAAEGVEAELEAAATAYNAGDLDEVIERLKAARSLEMDHGDDPSTSALVDQLLEECEEEEDEEEVPVKGNHYSPENLVHTGWTVGDGTGHEGYHFADYFRDGIYLGPDEHGIEPIVNWDAEIATDSASGRLDEIANAP